jgi:hypothetical protein
VTYPLSLKFALETLEAKLETKLETLEAEAETPESLKLDNARKTTSEIVREILNQTHEQLTARN